MSTFQTKIQKFVLKIKNNVGNLYSDPHKNLQIPETTTLVQNCLLFRYRLIVVERIMYIFRSEFIENKYGRL